MKITGQRRKAISPIVATVLIIAATLIAFAAVLGYIFGIFGSAAAKANVSISTQTSFGLSGGLPTGTIYFVNSGTSSTSVSSASLTYGGGSCTLPVTSAPSISPGSTVSWGPVTCSSGGTTGSVGETYNLNVVLADGSTTTFTGTFT